VGHFRVLVALSIVSERGPICHPRPPNASENRKTTTGKKERNKTDGLNEFFNGLLHWLTLFRRSLLLTLVVSDNKG